METRNKSAVELRETCVTCGLPLSGAGGNSLTSWIFGKSQCRCLRASRSNGETDSKELGSEMPRVKISDRYETISMLGSGGMGTVYKVRDKTLDRIFALKVLRRELADDREAQERFRQEVGAARTLSHPNLVSVYDHGLSEDGCPYFVMDYVEGDSLAEILSRSPAAGRAEDSQTEESDDTSAGRAAMELYRVLDLVSQVLEALIHAHENNIVHRDLKPSNILIREQDGVEVVKVVDFGIAKILPPPGQDTASLTKTAEIFGSPAYMSPEQCQGERVDHRSDLYSIGCLLFECLLAEPPFVRENPVKTILAHIYDAPPKVSVRLAGWENRHAIASVISTCLAKDRLDRYQSARELLTDIEHLQRGEEPLARLRKTRKEKRRGLRLMVQKYFPITLIGIALVLIVMAAMDLPWILTLGELRSAPVNTSEKAKSREALVSRLVSLADQHNKPFALMMAAVVQQEMGRDRKSVELTRNAMSIFEKRNDIFGILLGYRFLINSYLEKGDFANGRKIALESLDAVETRYDKSKKMPRKGLKLIGWFYLPNFYGVNGDVYESAVQSLYKHNDAEGAEIIIDRAISDSTGDHQRLKWILRKANHDLRFEKKNDQALVDEVLASSNTVSERDLRTLGFEYLAGNDINSATRVFERIINRYEDPNRDSILGEALCLSLNGDQRQARLRYQEVVQRMRISNYYDPAEEILELLNPLRKPASRATVDTCFKGLLEAVENYPDFKPPAFWERKQNKHLDQRQLKERKMKILDAYATQLRRSGRQDEAVRIRQRQESVLWEIDADYNPVSERKSPYEKDRIDYLRSLVRGYLMDGSYADARRLLAKLINIQWRDVPFRTRMTYAASHALTGDYKKCRQYLTEYLALEPDWKTTINLALCNLDCSLRNLERARKTYEAATAHDPDYKLRQSFNERASAELHLSRLFMTRGKIAEALAIVDGDVIYNSKIWTPLKIRYLKHCGELLSRTGKKEKAAMLEARIANLERTITGQQSYRAEYLDQPLWRVNSLDLLFRDLDSKKYAPGRR